MLIEPSSLSVDSCTLCIKLPRTCPSSTDRVSMRCERFVLGGRNYTCQDADDLPPDINPGKLAQRENDTTIVFDGSTSSRHVLSNFYNVRNNFVYEHRSYSSSEQAFQHKKKRQELLETRTNKEK